jgi:hypothetical protein
MSRHVGRKQRWQQHSATRYASAIGEVAYADNAWYGTLQYRTRVAPTAPAEPARWESHTVRLGPFKRPRNAMVALEREATILKNRHGADARIGGQLWAES